MMEIIQHEKNMTFITRHPCKRGTNTMCRLNERQNYNKTKSPKTKQLNLHSFSHAVHQAKIEIKCGIKYKCPDLNDFYECNKQKKRDEFFFQRKCKIIMSVMMIRLRSASLACITY